MTSRDPFQPSKFCDMPRVLGSAKLYLNFAECLEADLLRINFTKVVKKKLNKK